MGSRISSCEIIKFMPALLKGALNIQQIESSDKLHERASALKGRESRDCTSTDYGLPGAKIAPMEVTQRGAAHDANDTRNGQREFFVPVAIYICGSRGGGMESGPKTNCLLMSSINNSYCVRVCVGVNIFGWVVAQINLGRKT